MRKGLIILAVLLLLFGGAALALKFLGRGGGTTPPDETPEPGTLPQASERPELQPSASPETLVLSAACPENWSGLPDGDGDGLPDQVEARYLTNEAAADTDGDGFSDSDEVKAGFHPLKKEGNPRLDSDADGLFENEECQWKTDPFQPDTDGDGFRDGDEVKNGFDPTIKGDGQGSDALPERRAKDSQEALNQLRPNINSSNNTESLAALLTQNRSTQSLGSPPITAQQIEEALRNAPLNTTLPNIPVSEIRVKSSNTVPDVSAYLRDVDRISSLGLGDPTTIGNTFVATLNGNTVELHTLISQLTVYEQELLNTPTPPSAVAHHRALISMLRFTRERLTEAEQAAGSDPVKTVLAFRSLQEGLVQHLQNIQNLRNEVARLGGGA